MLSTRRVIGAATAAVVLAAGPAVRAEEPAAGCRAMPVYSKLDFWLGDWVVYVGDTETGRNRIERVLDGCAVTEAWESATGGVGMSLFYVADDGRWRQVWVTANAAAPGGTKEKSELPGASNDELRFQGEVRTEGGSYLDRTTLIRLDADSVRQLIEISTDDGASWRPVFDAVYRRR